jgi:hypothetical protein
MAALSAHARSAAAEIELPLASSTISVPECPVFVEVSLALGDETRSADKTQDDAEPRLTIGL